MKNELGLFSQVIDGFNHKSTMDFYYYYYQNEFICITFFWLKHVRPDLLCTFWDIICKSVSLNVNGPLKSNIYFFLTRYMKNILEGKVFSLIIIKMVTELLLISRLHDLRRVWKFSTYTCREVLRRKWF